MYVTRQCVGRGCVRYGYGDKVLDFIVFTPILSVVLWSAVAGEKKVKGELKHCLYILGPNLHAYVSSSRNVYLCLYQINNYLYKTDGLSFAWKIRMQGEKPVAILIGIQSFKSKYANKMYYL